MLGSALLLVLFGIQLIDLASGGGPSSSSYVADAGAKRLLVTHDGETADAAAVGLAHALGPALGSKGNSKDPGEGATAVARYEIIEGVETVWTPTSALPVGVALMLHGCSHSATDWFDRVRAP